MALVDLDIQSAALNNPSPSCMTTEDIYHKTYQDQLINTEAIEETGIIVTGWIHKEAYF